MNELQAVYGAAGAGVVMALVNALVKPFVPDTRLYPAFSILLGILWNLGVALATSAPNTLLQAGLVGTVTGLTASGLYSVAGKGSIRGTRRKNRTS